MASIYFLVEGKTEERFVKEIVQEYYLDKHFIYASQMPHKNGKGGYIKYDQAIKDIRKYLYSTAHCQKLYLLYDYYGLDVSLKNHIPVDNTNLNSRISSIQKRLEDEINNPKFHFRLQIHEYESYLFSNPDIFANHFDDQRLKDNLQDILNNFDNNPELINDSSLTAPSKRIESLMGKRYGKTSDGIIIMKKIGIDQVRSKCRYFDNFFKELDAIPYNE